jgi:hypothetical protein
VDRSTDLPHAVELAHWLDELARAPHPAVLLGGTGHLDLTAEEQQRVARQIEQSLLPRFEGLPADVDVFVLTGMAPGADLVITETTYEGFARQGRHCVPVALLPVPPEVLWEDWLGRAGKRQADRVAATRARFDLALRACERVVQLWDAGAPPDWQDRVVRQHQYRRLAAVLAGQCDVVVAALRAQHRGQPGGTAEVVAWRERSQPIPPELDTRARRHRSGWPHGDVLLVMNPAGEQAALPQARAALRGGNYLLSYDIVAKAEADGESSDELEYVKLQALANAGSTQAALRRLTGLPAALRERDEDWLALEGRLHKDLGLRGGEHAPQHFQRAAACYRRAFERTGGYFSAINAATTALLGGDAEAARALARDVLAQVGAVAAHGERDAYYLGATEAEAALLLGDLARVRDALGRTDRALPRDINARSRTRRQLRRVCIALKIDPVVLDALRLPPVVYLGAVRAEAVPAPAFAYAGITVPRELEAVERALASGAHVHGVLARPREQMIAHWQWAHGGAWPRRLEQFLDRAQEVSVALGFLESEDRWCDAYVGAMALGLSRLAARRLDSEWRPIGFDGTTTAELVPQKPAAPVETSGRVFQRRFAAIIFADFAGFSRLTDRELPVFWAHFMRAASERLRPLQSEILLKRTWGDALHLVFAHTRAAALAACELQACLEQLRPALPRGLAALELRLAAHYAPVFSGHDPVEDTATYFGTQLSFTARIEPVTPPGMIFVTEAFAAQLALEAPDDFALEYAGEVKLAKSYGQSRLFSLRPSSVD